MQQFMVVTGFRADAESKEEAERLIQDKLMEVEIDDAVVAGVISEEEFLSMFDFVKA